MVTGCTRAVREAGGKKQQKQLRANFLPSIFSLFFNSLFQIFSDIFNMSGLSFGL